MAAQRLAVYLGTRCRAAEWCYLGGKETHEAVASEASLRSQVERSEMTRVQANNVTIAGQY